MKKLPFKKAWLSWALQIIENTETLKYVETNSVDTKTLAQALQ